MMKHCVHSRFSRKTRTRLSGSVFNALAGEGKFVDTYRAIERLYDEKLIRATGVSNHHTHHLEKIFAKANV